MNKNKSAIKWYKKWWGILIIVFLIFLLAFILSFAWAVHNRVQKIRAEQNVKIMQNYLERLAPKDSPKKGSVTPALTIVEFADFECSYCAKVLPTMDRIIAEYGGLVQLVYRYVPITELYPDSWSASLAATCANEQDMFWQYHDKLFSEQGNFTHENLFIWANEVGLEINEFTNCYDSEEYAWQVRRDMNDSADLEIEGTPTFFLNGERLSGALSYDKWKILLDALLLNK